jgi:hypothetical protein
MLSHFLGGKGEDGIAERSGAGGGALSCIHKGVRLMEVTKS